MGLLRKIVKNVVERPIRDVGRAIERPVREVGRVIERPIREVARAVGLRKVHKTRREFKQEVEHARVIVTEDSYRVEKVTPCENGNHDIVEAEQPMEFHCEDDVMIIQDRYCRKCGQHFFTEP